jgi:hypothetical protein
VPVFVVSWRNVTTVLNEDFIDNEIFCCEDNISEKYFTVLKESVVHCDSILAHIQIT